jgi:hypothetical protein
MKFILISLLFISNLVFAQSQSEPDALEAQTDSNILGSIAQPTHEQKKDIHAAAKKAVKKQKASKKSKAVEKKTKKKSVN